MIIDGLSIEEGYKNVLIYDGLYCDSCGHTKLSMSNPSNSQSGLSKTSITGTIFLEKESAESKLKELVNSVERKNTYKHTNLIIVSAYDLVCNIKKAHTDYFDVNNQSIISGLVTKELHDRGFPSNPVNAARAGFVAALKYLGIETKNSFQ